MKASEMIAELQKLVAQYGDLPVYWPDSEWGGPVYEVGSITYEVPENWPREQIPGPIFSIDE